MPNNGKITWTFDVLGRLIARADALSQSESWGYNVPARTVTYTDRKNQTTTTQFDILERTYNIAYADGSSKSYTYDPRYVRLQSVTDSVSGTVQWGYDDFDQILSETSPQGKVSYLYDAAGRRQQMTAANQSQVIYGYDADNRLGSITQGAEAVGFKYDAVSRVQQLTLPNGVQANYGYYADSRIQSIQWLKADNTVLGNLAYGYDNVGRMISQTGSFAPQVLPAASTGANGFDANNRQTPYNGQALAYDLNGNLIGDGVRTYVWDARNRLTSITQGATTIASFQYDALGRRIARTENGQTTSYLYDGLNAVQETVGTTINPILTGLGIDTRYARNDVGGVRTYFLTDAVGSTRALTSTTGAVLDVYDYDLFGNGTQTASGYNNPYQYTGREHDASGLYYYRARYYQPLMGRFISEDAIGLRGGLNTYAYVRDNPLQSVDPTGNSPAADVAGLIGEGIAIKTSDEATATEVAGAATDHAVEKLFVKVLVWEGWGDVTSGAITASQRGWC